MLHGFANTAYLRHFLFPGLPRVAPYCARGGVKVVSGLPVFAVVASFYYASISWIGSFSFSYSTGCTTAIPYHKETGIS